MAKIIEVTKEIISIGMDDGSIKEVRPSDVPFVPQVGDLVDIFETETRTIVQKKDAPQKEAAPQGGIYINMSNTQNPAPVAPPASVVVSSGKVVNKVMYCILALFLGGFGVHKFYAGKSGSGILYLLFCWTGIPVILGVIEGISALCKHADAAGNITV